MKNLIDSIAFSFSKPYSIKPKLLVQGNKELFEK